MVTIQEQFVSSDGTVRYLLRLDDGEFVEAVRIPREDRVTFCISSQAGCGFGCTFCLTGQLGFIRDLSADEIIEQILSLRKETPSGNTPDDERASIVFMGMGEPLANYDNVLKAIHFFHDGHGLKLPMSRITVSTAGLVPAIRRLGKELLFPNLSISLTGATNGVRDELMPINRKYPIEQVIESVRELPPQRQKRVMFECVMIKGLTDSLSGAEELSQLVRGLGVKVNLIPLNPADEIPFERPDDKAVLAFQKVLMRNGVATFIRKNRGNDVSGACGQLKKKSS